MVSDAELAVASRPLQEGLWAALMLGLYRCGRQSDALRAFQRLRQILGEELGIEPSSDLRSLEEAVLLQKPELDWRDLDRKNSSHGGGSARGDLQEGDAVGPVHPGGIRPDGLVARDSRPRAAHNLPVQLSSFLGRARELAAGEKLLAASRIVTVTGPGGTGKTRLAYQLAAQQLERLPGGVWVAELASLSDPALVPAALMTVLGLQDEPGRGAAETVVAYLQDRQVLVVLDNCEHVIDAAASLCSDLLAGCGGLRVLATSREPLRVTGEAVWTLGPLALPDPTELDPEIIAGSDAVALFCERAAEARVGFALTVDNAATVSAVCARLEGIPLAIELAAARVRTLALGEVAQRLDHSLALLSKGPRDVDHRQASLRATFAWSHDLLTPPEQTLFRRLSVFAGGFTLEAAESVCSGDGLDINVVLDDLDGLVDKSVVTVGEDGSGRGRYRMLETIRAYATERLDATGGKPQLADRHATFYSSLAGDYAQQGDTEAALDRLETDHSNLLAAIEHLSSQRDPAFEHGQLVADLSPFWEHHGYWQLGARQLRRYLDRPEGDPALRGRCAGELGRIHLRLGDYQEARVRFDEALTVARQLGDRRGEGRWLGHLGDVCFNLGDFPAARGSYEEARVIASEIGDRRTEGIWVGYLAQVALYLKDLPAALTLFQQALAIARESGDRRFEGRWLGELGIVASALGDYPVAQAGIDKAIGIASELGDRRIEGIWVGVLGELASNVGDYSRGQPFLEEALGVARHFGERHFEGRWVGRLGEVAANRGDYSTARTRYEEALGIARQLGDRYYEGIWIGALGQLACDLKDYPEARKHYEQALTIARDLDKRDVPLLEACAELLVRLDRCQDAAGLVVAADDLAMRYRHTRSASDQARYEATLAICRTQVSDRTFLSASTTGQATDWGTAIDTALGLLTESTP